MKLRSGFGGGTWNWLYLAWALLGMAAPFAARSGLLGSGRTAEILFALSFTWIAIVGMACVGFILMDLTSLAARIVDLIAGTTFTARFFSPRKCVPVTLILITLVVLYSFFEAWNVRYVELTLKTTKLPEGVDRLRLVYVTDVHLGGLYAARRLERIMDLVRSARPDIFAVTGDLVDGDMSGRQYEVELLASHGSRYGAFAVTGNHDFYAGIEQSLAFMEKSGLTVIRDERKDVAGITLVGLDDPAKFRRGFNTPEHWPEDLNDLSADRFVLLLKHRPQLIEGTAGKFDLQLSGHTHGGQIWPFGYLANRVNNSVQHLSQIEGSFVYVSNGAGFWGPPLRLLTPPEVTIIDLVRE